MPTAVPDDRQARQLLAHRAVIEEARLQGLDQVLIFEDDVLFLDAALEVLARSVDELSARDWRLFFLGGFRAKAACPPARDCRHLSSSVGLSCTFALACHRTVFDRLLSDLPDTADGAIEWLEKHRGLDHYYRSIDRAFLSEPSVASTPELLHEEDEHYQGRFTLGEPTG